MARKDDNSTSREARHGSNDDRQRRHLQPRGQNAGRESWVSREPPMYFFAAFSHEDEIPPDTPRD